MIATEAIDGITVIRLDRPADRNAMVPALLAALATQLKSAAALGQPVMLTGNGPTFCVGADLKWLSSLHDPALGVADLVASHHLAINTMIDMPVPVIAAVNGPAAGGGISLALAADYCLAAAKATFTMAYFKLGLTPDGGSSTFLERAIGPSRTKELLLTNRRLSAREAFEWGMINEVVPDTELLERSLAFARGLERVPGYTMLETRRLLDSANLRNQLQLESVAIRTAARGEFFKAALRAYAEAHPD